MGGVHFVRFAAIDWSGAKGRSHRGIALAICEAGEAAPALVPPPGRHWSRAHGYRGWVSLEWERTWYPQVAPVEEILPGAAAWVRRFGA